LNVTLPRASLSAAAIALQLQTSLDEIHRVLLETLFGQARLAIGEVDTGR
jgi:hypothetical protein